MDLELEFFVEVRRPDGSWQWHERFDPTRGRICSEPLGVQESPSLFALLGYRFPQRLRVSEQEANPLLARRSKPDDLSPKLASGLAALEADADRHCGLRIKWITLPDLWDLVPLAPDHVSPYLEALATFVENHPLVARENPDPEEVRVVFALYWFGA
ncbi:MAG: hypothetical protein QNK04_09265 [Myxococcota bacterium]|nr:hypothetical protein [Myxococcota bacterium]